MPCSRSYPGDATPDLRPHWTQVGCLFSYDVAGMLGHVSRLQFQYVNGSTSLGRRSAHGTMAARHLASIHSSAFSTQTPACYAYSIVIASVRIHGLLVWRGIGECALCQDRLGAMPRTESLTSRESWYYGYSCISCSSPKSNQMQCSLLR